MLTYYKQIDKRTTMKNQNRNAALGRPAMKLLGGGGGGGGLQLVCGQPTLALSKITIEPKQKSRLGTASNKNYWGGGGLQLVCGRPTLALSSALVPQTLSCLVCVEDS